MDNQFDLSLQFNLFYVQDISSVQFSLSVMSDSL